MLTACYCTTSLSRSICYEYYSRPGTVQILASCCKRVLVDNTGYSYSTITCSKRLFYCKDILVQCNNYCSKKLIPVLFQESMYVYRKLLSLRFVWLRAAMDYCRGSWYGMLSARAILLLLLYNTE